MSLYKVGVLPGSNGRAVYAILEKYIEQNPQLNSFFDSDYPVASIEAQSAEQARALYRMQYKGD